MVLINFDDDSKPRTTFLTIAMREMVISRGDPMAMQPLPETGTVFRACDTYMYMHCSHLLPNIHICTANTGLLVAYLVYHMYVRIQLLTLWTHLEILPSMEEDIKHSMEAVEAAATRISLLQPGSDTRRHWDSVKLSVLSYVRHGRGDLISLSCDYTAVGQRIESEIRQKTSRRVYAVVTYLQNMQAVVGNTSVGIMVPSDAVQKYLKTVSKLDRRCLSEDYWPSMDSVEKLMRDSLSRQLSAAEIEKVHMTFSWQTENVFTHFKPEELESSEPSRWRFSERHAVFPIPASLEACRPLLKEALVTLTLYVSMGLL